MIATGFWIVVLILMIATMVAVFVVQLVLWVRYVMRKCEEADIRHDFTKKRLNTELFHKHSHFVDSLEENTKKLTEGTVPVETWRTPPIKSARSPRRSAAARAKA